MKPIGGLPMNTSSGVGLSVERGKQSQIAMTSRWKCIVPFGRPVVPEVKAISATSSLAVSRLANSGALRRMRCSSSAPAPGVPSR